MSAQRAQVIPMPVGSTGLARYDAMCQAIAECHTVDEVKEIRDRARAFEVYAQQALNMEAERKACEIRIRAERKAGQLLKEMKQSGDRHTGRGDQKSASKPTTPKLADLGITRDQSSQWQKLAEIPEEEFEREVSGPGPKPSTEGMVNSRILAENPTPRIDVPALRLWGWFKGFEQDIAAIPETAYDLMLPFMAEDVQRILPAMVQWLKRIKR